MVVDTREALLPLWEKVAPEGGRMRGFHAVAAWLHPFVQRRRATPHPALRATFSRRRRRRIVWRESRFEGTALE